MLAENSKKQIQEVVRRLSAFRPNQICIEVPASKQPRIDSTYAAFLKGNYKLGQNEIDQLAFQTAKQLNLEKLTCVNYAGRFETDSMNNFARDKNQTIILNNLDVYVKAFLKELTEMQNALALSDYLIYLNSKAALNKNLSIYTNYIRGLDKLKLMWELMLYRIGIPQTCIFIPTYFVKLKLTIKQS